MDPQEEDEVLPPDKEGEGDNSEHQEEQLDVHMEPQYQCDTEEEEETDDNAVSYRTNAIRIASDTEKQAVAKIMAMQTNATVSSKTIAFVRTAITLVVTCSSLSNAILITLVL